VIKLYSPRNEGEAALVESILSAAGIPFFVHNEFFGAMRVGPQIDLLNMKTFMVSEESGQEAQELIADYLQTTRPAPRPTLLRDRIRVVIELLLFGWFIPGRMPCRRAYDQLSDDETRAV